MTLHDLNTTLENNGVIFSFSGAISQPILVGIGETIESKFELMQLSNKIIQNIFGVLTEQMQNIMSYSKNKKSNTEDIVEAHGVTIVGYEKDEDRYYISSGNEITQEEGEKLKVKLEKINAMDPDEVRAYYKELRKSGRDSHAKGAGLGFLEMAKRSTHPLNYNIEAIDNGLAFFEIKVYI